MAVRGSGPSRRSHTKSRKGCRTCKRRHIRCDESFPQCRNCTKHHVRCDYMDATTPDSDSISTTSSVQTSPTPTHIGDDTVLPHQFARDSLYQDMAPPLSDAMLNNWGADPHLISNLFDTINNLDAKGAGDLTAWTYSVRRFSTLAPSSPYLLDALKAFSAGQLAWVSQSPAAREQALAYASSAIVGLHEAVGQFNKSNADAVLAASVLLATQSRDWLSFSSLMGGLKSVAAAIGTWENESIYSDMVKDLNATFAGQHDTENLPSAVSVQERAATLERIHQSLHTLRTRLVGRAVELHWVDQFVDLVQRLRSTEPAKTSEEGFNHMYVLRKWVYWLPPLLLQDGPIDMLKLSLIAHLYAIPLVLTPTLAHVRGDLCGTAASVPLLSVLGRMRATQEQMRLYEQHEFAALIDFPQASLNEYNERYPWSPAHPREPTRFPDISMFVTDENEAPGNLSPAFAPSNFAAAHSRASSATSLFLEVPPPGGYTPQPVSLPQNFTAQWGTFPSPNFPSQEFYGGDDLLFTEEEQSKPLSAPFGNFMQPCEIWT